MSEQRDGPPTLPPDAVIGRRDSGLEYFEIAFGDGEAILPGIRVRVHYRAWLTDGTQVENTPDVGEPVEFVVGDGEVLPGLEEGVEGMKPGGRRRLIVPSDLAYGPRGAEPRIPPYATLIFDVELVS